MDQIEELNSFTNCVFYRTSCDCMSPNHNLNFFLGYEEDMNMLEMHFEVVGPAPNCFDYESSFHGRIWNRIRLCCMVLFKNRIAYEGTFIFRGEKYIRDLIKALEEGLDRSSQSKKFL